MKRRLFGTVLAAAVAMAGCNKPAEGGNAGSGGAKANLPTEVTLRLKGKVGDKYTMVTTLDTSADLPGPDGKMQTGTMTMTATEENSCTKVEGEKMTWESKNVDVQASGTGPFAQQAEMAKSQEKGKVQIKVRDGRNQVVDSKEPESMALVYPEKAVKVGDTWEGDSDLMGKKVKVTFKLDRFEVFNGKTAAVLVATMSASDQLTATEPLTVFVDVETGWPLKGGGSFDMMPQPGIKAKLKVKMEVK